MMEIIVFSKNYSFEDVSNTQQERNRQSNSMLQSVLPDLIKSHKKKYYKHKFYKNYDQNTD